MFQRRYSIHKFKFQEKPIEMLLENYNNFLTYTEIK
jgi:hypothetical protein